MAMHRLELVDAAGRRRRGVVVVGAGLRFVDGVSDSEVDTATRAVHRVLCPADGGLGIFPGIRILRDGIAASEIPAGAADDQVVTSNASCHPGIGCARPPARRRR